MISYKNCAIIELASSKQFYDLSAFHFHQYSCWMIFFCKVHIDAIHDTYFYASHPEAINFYYLLSDKFICFFYSFTNQHIGLVFFYRVIFIIVNFHQQFLCTCKYEEEEEKCQCLHRLAVKWKLLVEIDDDANDSVEEYEPDVLIGKTVEEAKEFIRELG